MILGTVLLRVKENSNTHELPIRGFCDSGSQVNLITERCVQSLGLRKLKANVPLVSITGSTSIKYKVIINLLHRYNNNYQIQIEALVVANIPGNFPNEMVQVVQISPDQLADPQYFVPRPVDILLGAGFWAETVLPDVRRFADSLAIAQNTHFGFIVYGQMSTKTNLLRSYHISTLPQCTDERLDKLLL